MTTGIGVFAISALAISSNGLFRLFFLFMGMVELRGSDGATSPAIGDGGLESVIFLG